MASPSQFVDIRGVLIKLHSMVSTSCSAGAATDNLLRTSQAHKQGDVSMFDLSESHFFE